jgi:hypothetical protein
LYILPLLLDDGVGDIRKRKSCKQQIEISHCQWLQPMVVEALYDLCEHKDPDYASFGIWYLPDDHLPQVTMTEFSVQLAIRNCVPPWMFRPGE